MRENLQTIINRDTNKYNTVTIINSEQIIAIVTLVVCLLIALIVSTILLVVSIAFITHLSKPAVPILIFSGCCVILVVVGIFTSGPAFITSYIRLSPLVYSILCMAP